MSSTLQGVLTIIGVGLLILVIAAALDLRSKRRADRALATPPSTETPDGTPLPTPDYVSADALSRSEQAPSPLTADESAALASATQTPTALHLARGLADPRQGTRTNPDDPSAAPRAVLEHPMVLVVSDGIGSPREALQTLERAAKAKEAIVLASSAIDPEVVDMVTVNVRQSVISAITLVLDADDLTALAATTGAGVLTRADLQSGYVPHSAYGRAAWVIADADETTVVPTGTLNQT